MSRILEQGSDSSGYNGDSLLEMTSVRQLSFTPELMEHIGLGTVAGEAPDYIKQHAPILRLPI